MRSFIGLDLSATEKLALDSWRQQALPEVMPRQWVKSESIRSRKSSNKRYDHTNSQGPAQPYAVPAANFAYERTLFSNPRCDGIMERS